MLRKSTKNNEEEYIENLNELNNNIFSFCYFYFGTFSF